VTRHSDEARIGETGGELIDGKPQMVSKFEQFPCHREQIKGKKPSVIEGFGEHGGVGVIQWG